MKHIIVNHPFFDGNKRTAFEVTDIILRNEGFYIYVEEEKIQNLLLKIAKYECTANKIEKWLIKATSALHPG